MPVVIKATAQWPLRGNSRRDAPSQIHRCAGSRASGVVDERPAAAHCGRRIVGVVTTREGRSSVCRYSRSIGAPESGTGPMKTPTSVTCAGPLPVVTRSAGAPKGQRISVLTITSRPLR